MSKDGFMHKQDLIDASSANENTLSEYFRRLKERFPESIRSDLIVTTHEGKRRLGLTNQQVSCEKKRLLMHQNQRVIDLAEKLP